MRLWKHIPNVLTLLRLVLCPLIIALFLQHEYPWGLALFTIAAITDFFDGYLARRFDLRTPLGALLDPISDKVLTVSFFSLLMTLGACPPWFLGLWIALNLLQGLGYLLIRMGRGEPVPIRPPRLAKWNTALQFAWIGILLADVFLRYRFPRNFHYSLAFHIAGYTLLAAMQINVFFHYFFEYRANLVPDMRAGTDPHGPQEA